MTRGAGHGVRFSRVGQGCVLVLLAGVLGACATDPIDFAKLSLHPASPGAGVEATAPHALIPPAGNVVALVLVASGEAKFQCGDAGGTYAWQSLGAHGRLYAPDHHLVGHDDDWREWEYQDGSKVGGKVIESAPSITTESMAQALYRATDSAPSGAFAGVTYIQRVHTIGGVPPKQPCSNATTGTQQQSVYSADYIFFKALGSQKASHAGP